MDFTIIDEYLALLEQYESVSSQKNERMEISEQLILRLPSFIQTWKEEFGEEPTYFSFRDRLLNDYLKDGQYDRAMHLTKHAAFDEENVLTNSLRIQVMASLSSKVLSLLVQKPGMFETEIMTHFTVEDEGPLLWFFEHSNLIQRVSTYAGNRFWLKTQIVSTVEKEVHSHQIDPSKFGGWYIALSFYPTNSKKFNEVLSLAQAAPQFLERKDESSRIYYQAAYSANKEDFISFSKLFKLAKDWKTCELIVNGDKIDMKLFAPIIECYELKLTAEETYCFGLDESVSNPFGCHKLGLTPKNEPWWTYGHFDSKNVWHVNKKAIMTEVKTNMKLCKYCPAFSEKKALEVYESIPLQINSDDDTKWYRSGYSIRPIPGKDPLS